MRVQLCARVVSGAAAFVLAAGGSMVLSALPAAATTYTVASTADGGNGSGSLRDVVTNDAVTDGDVVVLQAGATYVLDTNECNQLILQAAITIRSTSTTQNATIEQTCGGDEVIFTDYDLTVQNITITGGSTNGDGGGIDAQASLALDGAEIINNKAEDDGGGVDVNGSLTIRNTTFANNCAGDVGGAFRGGTLDNPVVSILNSTFTGNRSSDGGVLDGGGSAIELAYATVVGNTLDPVDNDCDLGMSTNAADVDPPSVDPSDTAANVDASQLVDNAVIATGGLNLSAFATVVSQFTGDGALCETDVSGGGTTTSYGYNFAGDTSCGFTNTAAGDRQDVTDPAVGALAANGGPTQTKLPATGSPLLDAVPLAACETAPLATGVVADQRGLVRPGVATTGCDIGAVELQGVALQPRFTG